MDFDKQLPNTQHFDNDDDDINVQKPVVTSTMQSSSSDHSPMSNQSGGGNLPKSNASSADGFEHIDEKIDLDLDLLGGHGAGAGDVGFNTGPPPPLQQQQQQQQHKFSNDLIGDYLNDGGAYGKSQNENIHTPFAASLQDQAKATMDFMHSERYINEPIMQPKQPKDIPQQPLAPAPTAPPPSKQFDEFKNSSLLDEIEEDYLNPYAATAATKLNEKFSSSEDLIGNIKDNVEKLVEPISTKPIIDTTLTRDIGFIQEPMPPMLPPKNIQEKPFEIPKPAVAPPKEEIIKKPAPPPPSPPPPAPTTATTTSSSSTTVKPTHVEVIKDDKKKSGTGKGQRISAEEMFYKIGLDAWFKPERLHPIVESLIYWRDVKKSGIAFGTGFLFLLALTYFSVLSVIAYSSLLIVTGTLAFRIYKLVIAAVQKTSDGHPFKEYLEMDIALPQDKVQDLTVIATAHINAFVQELRHIFLVEDLVDTIRFVVLMWFITYLGSWFNGMTLFIIAFVALFTLPKVYENNKQSIDTYLDLVKSKYVEITDKVKAAIPIGKKPESDKEK